MKDSVTGLMWEGKDATGTRASSRTYSNYGDGRSGDASAYVTAVNAMDLCGFNDWRLPKATELQSLVAYGLTGGPLLNTLMFPNAVAQIYWSAEDYLSVPTLKWGVFCGSGAAVAAGEGASNSVRLVRGSVWSGRRYLVTGASHDDDFVHNAVLDRKTGLTWRRCMEGQVWNGENCLAAASKFTHQQALAWANSRSGWRLPNAKELASLRELEREMPALDSIAFPGMGGGVDTWSSTPVPGSSQAWYAAFNNGYFGQLARSNLAFALLVKNGP